MTPAVILLQHGVQVETAIPQESVLLEGAVVVDTEDNLADVRRHGQAEQED